MVIVPTIIERNANSERVYDLYSCLLKRTYYHIDR